MMGYRILRDKRPLPNKRPPLFFFIANHKDLKEMSGVLKEINAKWR